MTEETQAGEARSTPDTEERPRTEAGRALLASLLDAIHIEWGSDPEGDDILLREILAIEAEAATPQQAEPGLRRRWDDDRDGIEWRLRAAAPQPAEPGLREAIHRHRDGCNGRPHRRWYRGENKCDVLAALARDAAPGLDAAWAEAEAALPEGWMLVVSARVGDYVAQAIHRRREMAYGPGPTPTAALLALAARLRESAKPTTAVAEEKPLWGEDGPTVGQTITIAGTDMRACWTGTHWELVD